MSRYIDEREVQLSPSGFNTETEKIARTQQDSLSRKDTDGPNQMETDLDMNSQRIINLPVAISANEALTYGQALDFIRPPSAIPRDAVILSDLKYLGSVRSVRTPNIFVTGFYAGTEVGGGEFIWKPSEEKANHNGITVIDPDRVREWNGFQSDLGTLFEIQPQGYGCFVRKNYKYVTPAMSGMLQGTASHNHVALSQLVMQDLAVDFGSEEYGVLQSIGDGQYKEGTLNWVSSGCRIYYDGEESEDILLYCRITPTEHSIHGELTFDGQMKVQGGVWFRNDSPEYGTFYANKVTVRNIRRISDGLGGSGFFVQGAFRSVVLENPTVRDLRMAEGTGVALSQGVNGIAVSRDGTSGLGSLYTRIVNPYVENIESEDLTYQVDQDGIAIMTQPLNDSVWTSFDVVGGTMINCFGRSIKSQTSGGTIQGTHFIRNRGLASGQGNEEIRSQRGCVNVRDITFEYDSYAPRYLCTQGISAKNEASGVIDGINGSVRNTTIENVIGTYSRQTLHEINVTNISIRGSVDRLVQFLVPNSGVVLNLDNVYADEILQEGISVRSGGIGDIELNPHAIINARNVQNAGLAVPLVLSPAVAPATFDLTISGQIDGFIDAEPIDVNDLILQAQEEGVLFADYRRNIGKAINGIAVQSGTATDVITYSAPDGQLGESRSGAILSLPEDVPAFVWRDGEFGGLQVLPEDTVGSVAAVTASKSLEDPIPRTFSLLFEGSIFGGSDGVQGGQDFHGILTAHAPGRPAADTACLAIIEDVENQRLRMGLFNHGDGSLFISYSEGYSPGMKLKALACVDRDNGTVKFFVNGVKVQEAPFVITNPDWDNMTEILMGSGLRIPDDYGNGHQERIMDAVLPYVPSDREAIALTTL